MGFPASELPGDEGKLCSLIECCGVRRFLNGGGEDAPVATPAIQESG